MLQGKIAVVTGASRGVGRGIALQLGQEGCTVYVTGRKPTESLANGSDLPSLQKTADEVTARGGCGIARYVDHADMENVREFFEELDKEIGGQIDILVNNAYSGVPFLAANIGKTFFESDASLWDDINNVGLRNHYHCSVYAARAMAKRKRGLIVNVSSVGGLYNVFNVPYGVGKCALDRMARDMAVELKPHNVTAISLWPGAVKTELCMGAVESGPEGIGRDNYNDLFNNGESCEFVGMCVAHLAADKKNLDYTGRILFTSDVAGKYGFKDIDGRLPPNMRSIRHLFTLVGRTETAKWFPEWVKFPGWMLTAAESMM